MSRKTDPKVSFPYRSQTKLFDFSEVFLPVKLV